jgi:hypothetical protein
LNPGCYSPLKTLKKAFIVCVSWLFISLMSFFFFPGRSEESTT